MNISKIQFVWTTYVQKIADVVQKGLYLIVQASVKQGSTSYELYSEYSDSFRVLGGRFHLGCQNDLSNYHLAEEMNFQNHVQECYKEDEKICFVFEISVVC